jgi:anti-sigma factor RsiW
MKHVTVDEMIGFVSMDTLDADSLALASKVNTHIRSCPHCRGTVRAFQAICDEMTALGDRQGFPAAAKRAYENAVAQKAPQQTMTRYD